MGFNYCFGQNGKTKAEGSSFNSNILIPRKVYANKPCFVGKVGNFKLIELLLAVAIVVVPCVHSLPCGHLNVVVLGANFQPRRQIVGGSIGNEITLCLARILNSSQIVFFGFGIRQPLCIGFIPIYSYMKIDYSRHGSFAGNLQHEHLCLLPWNKRCVIIAQIVPNGVSYHYPFCQGIGG